MQRIGLIGLFVLCIWSAGGAAAAQDFVVDICKADKVCAGTTLLGDNHRRGNPRVIEVNLQGEIVWEYVLPQRLKRYTNPGFDVEQLPNRHILLVLPGKGIYEIDRSGKTVWSHLDSKVSHDADRLANGNTLYVFGNEDSKADAQVKEVEPSGRQVWSWYAREAYDKPPYAEGTNQGWTHTNAVTRLANGNTLISPRNFNMLVEVDPQGKTVRTVGAELLKYQHDPELLDNGNILVANHQEPHEIVELEKGTEKIVWRFPLPRRKVWPVRDANRLPNGNTLIVGTTVILEVTPQKEVVWRLRMAKVPFRNRQEAPALGFYKAQRIPE